jgi:hypothetical protein
MLVAMLLEAVNYTDLQNSLRLLPDACKNSKQKRQPQLHLFSSA